MADLDVGLSGLGGQIHGHVKAVPPFGWVGLIALAAVCVLGWHYWYTNDEDTSSWTDPQQPPENVDVPPSSVLGPNLARPRRSVGPIPGAV